MVLNPAGTTAYTSNISGHSVSVIDTATNTVTATVPVTGFPESMTLTRPAPPPIPSASTPPR